MEQAGPTSPLPLIGPLVPPWGQGSGPEASPWKGGSVGPTWSRERPLAQRPKSKSGPTCLRPSGAYIGPPPPPLLAHHARKSTLSSDARGGAGQGGRGPCTLCWRAGRGWGEGGEGAVPPPNPRAEAGGDHSPAGGPPGDLRRGRLGRALRGHRHSGKALAQARDPLQAHGAAGPPCGPVMHSGSPEPLGAFAGNFQLSVCLCFVGAAR